MVVGGGPGGLACAKACRAFGAVVAVVDQGAPSPGWNEWAPVVKLLLRDGPDGGVAEGPAGSPPTARRARWQTLCHRVAAHVAALNAAYEAELREVGVDHFSAVGTFVSPHRLELAVPGKATQTVTAQYFVLAMGGQPAYPDIPGACRAQR